MARISVASINEEVKALKSEVSEMKSDIAEIKSLLLNKSVSNRVPTVSGKGGAKLYSVELKDYEPKKSADGNYNWSSYKAKRTDYCYAVATKGKALGCYEKGVKVVDFKDIEADFNKAKEQFSNHFKYIRKADR